jgi:hypothetical protein
MSGKPHSIITIGLAFLLLMGLTGCGEHKNGSANQTNNETQGPTLRLTTRRDYSNGVYGNGYCSLSASRKFCGGGIDDDRDILRLLSIETNGFHVLFQRVRAGGTNGLDCFFPYKTITVTQVFNSMWVTGEFR